MSWNQTKLWNLYFFICMFPMFWVWVVLVLTGLRLLPEGHELCVCDVIHMFWSRFFKPNNGNVLVCSMICLYLLLSLLSSFLVWSRGVCLWDIWFNHFWVLGQLYLGYFLVSLLGLKCFLDLGDVMLWHVWLNFFESLINIIGILSSFSLRTDGYCDLSLMLSSCS